MSFFRAAHASFILTMLFLAHLVVGDIAEVSKILTSGN